MRSDRRSFMFKRTDRYDAVLQSLDFRHHHRIYLAVANLECAAAGCFTHTMLPSGSWILISQPTVGISHFGKMIVPPLATMAAAAASMSSTAIVHS